MFTAERLASAPPPGSRIGGVLSGQRPGLAPGTMPRTPPPTGAAALRRAPPPPRSPSPGGELAWPGAARPRLSQPPPSLDSYRRDAAMPRGYGQNDQYDGERPHRASGEPARANAFRDPNDYRGAHARELSSVEDHGDDLFEDEQASLPRRAEVQDYHQAYREYEVSYPEESRRRLGPSLLLFALLAVAAIGAGTLYLYQRNTAGPLFAKDEAPVPVVAGDGQPVKAEPEAAAEVQEPAENNQPGEQQVSTAPSVPTSAQRKQIYDRILDNETTLEEQEQLAPGEEQPVKPPPENQNAGPSFETQSDSVSGQALDSEPLPLPLPPPPGGSPDDESGGLDITEPPEKKQADGSLVPVAASSAPAATEADVQPSPTSAPQADPGGKPELPGNAATKGSEEILASNEPQQDLIASSGTKKVASPPPEPGPALSNTGPVQIAPQVGATDQGIDPNLAALPPTVPNATTIRKTFAGSRNSKGADARGVG